MVVEAAPRSGSLITARLATEAGREVMTVPGSPLDLRGHCCNQLIRDGATLVQSAPAPYEAPIAPIECDEAATSTVEELLGPNPVPVDEIIRLSGVPSGAVQMALLKLDLAGRLERHAGGKVSLR